MSARSAWMVIGLALAWSLCAAGRGSAQLSSSDFRFTRDLDVKVLEGYPITRHGYYGPLVFGVHFDNHGEERVIDIDVLHPSRTSRSLRVPENADFTAFFVLPARGGYGMSAVFELGDSLSGKHRRVSADAEFKAEEPFARLGPISTAMNVNSPWTLIGSLDGRMPDDWRGLSGIRMIAVEYGYANTHVRDWRALIDWVAMGGVLLVATPDARMTELPPWGSQLPFARPVRETQTGLVQQVGYGAIVRVSPGQLMDVSGAFLERIGVCESCRWSVAEGELDTDQPRKAARSRLLGMVAEPGWGLFGVLFLFATAVGPVGWIWLVKGRGLPLRYLAFVIANAALFSLAVLGHDLFENGIDAKCADRSLVLLDQRIGRELGIEDAALYAPTRRGTTLRVPLGAVAMLPGGASTFDSEPMQLSVADEHERIAGAVPVRQREFAAVRWLHDRHGGLELDARDGVLWVENQTGRALQSLVLWREGASYRVDKLARGARARAEPITAAEADLHAPRLSAGVAVGNAAPLARALIDGELGGNRYAATYAWSAAESALLGDGVKSGGGTQHVLAGVF